MKKIVLMILIVIVSSFEFCSAFGFWHKKEQKEVINTKYKKEIVKRCPTQEEIDKNPKNYTNIECIVNFDNITTEKKAELALDFSKKIKYLYRNQDVKTLSIILPYPLYIHNYKKSNITIKSKKEFLKLDRNIIMNKKIFEEIDKYPLFWNWQGFTLGNGQIWFLIDDKISDVIFNLE